VEALFGCWKVGAIPVNINWRYVPAELRYVIDDAELIAMIVEDEYLPTLAELGFTDNIVVGEWADASPVRAFADAPRSSDDVYMLYTGGTTGMPKGVMWRQEDVFRTLGGGADPLGPGPRPQTLAEHVENVRNGTNKQRLLPACPIMHGTGLFTAVNALMNGGSVVTIDSRTFRAHALWDAVERQRISAISIVGDVFARPMVQALEEKKYDLDSLRLIISSGVMWSLELKKALLAHHPMMLLFDSLGSSEATGLGASVMGAGMEVQTASFKVGDRVKVLTEDGREVAAGSGERGLVARSGPIPIGYYKDAEKTARTFRTIDGVRYSMPGDFATVEADGTLQLLGRGSACINTGGEKVFPEEVEEVLKRHPDVEDAATVGMPDPTWGQSIHSLVVLKSGGGVGESELRAHVRDHLAAYKVPKRVFVVDTLGRSPSGKMDYKGVTARMTELVGGA
jgi:acyl-CoA synthetase (AMP-forming)/AMP-acid ligase II